MAGSRPTAGQLIIAGVFSALLCLPIYALLLSSAMYLTSLLGSGFGRPSPLELLAAMFLMIPMSVFGVIVWPLSLTLAACLFALTGKALTAQLDSAYAQRWMWAGAGAAVGLLTGLVMAVEGYWGSAYPLGAQSAWGTIAFGIPTGTLGALICRRILRHFTDRPGRHSSTAIIDRGIIADTSRGNVRPLM